MQICLGLCFASQTDSLCLPQKLPSEQPRCKTLTQDWPWISLPLPAPSPIAQGRIDTDGERHASPQGLGRKETAAPGMWDFGSRVNPFVAHSPLLGLCWHFLHLTSKPVFSLRGTGTEVLPQHAGRGVQEEHPGVSERMFQLAVPCRKSPPGCGWHGWCPGTQQVPWAQGNWAKVLPVLMEERVQLQHSCLGTCRELARWDMSHFCMEQLRRERTSFLSQSLAKRDLCPTAFGSKFI